MKPIALFPEAATQNLLGIFFDIDDTFSLHGRIPAAPFTALWEIEAAGLSRVPITGRPAGWCDHIARMWPVTGVIGENGAFYFHYDRVARRFVKRFFFDPDQAAETRDRLLAATKEVLRSVPGTAPASDQPYRLFDTAVDFCEDVPPLPRSEVDRICRIFEGYGLTCKVSSIHVNAWFGNYDKLTMTKLFAQEVLGVDLETTCDRFVFFGDSPNDEPMFSFFPNSVGVANVRGFLDRMKVWPAYVTENEGGIGFAEGVRAILDKRRESARNNST